MKDNKPTFKERFKDTIVVTGIIALIDLIALIPLFQALLSYLLTIIGLIIGFVLWILISIPSLLFLTNDMPSNTDFMWGVPEPFTAWIIFFVITILFLIYFIYGIWESYSPEKESSSNHKEKSISSEKVKKDIEQVPEIKITRKKWEKMLKNMLEIQKIPFESLNPQEKKLFIVDYTDKVPDSIKPGDIVRRKGTESLIAVAEWDDSYIRGIFIETNEATGLLPKSKLEYPIYKY